MSRRSKIFHQVERQDRPVGKMARRAARAGLLASLGNVGIKRAIAVHRAGPVPIEPPTLPPPPAQMTIDHALSMTALDFEAFRQQVSKLQGRPVGKDEILEELRAASLSSAARVLDAATTPEEVEATEQARRRASPLA